MIKSKRLSWNLELGEKTGKAWIMTDETTRKERK